MLLTGFVLIVLTLSIGVDIVAMPRLFRIEALTSVQLLRVYAAVSVGCSEGFGHDDPDVHSAGMATSYVEAAGEGLG